MNSVNSGLWNEVSIEKMEVRDEYGCISFCFDCICFSCICFSICT